MTTERSPIFVRTLIDLYIQPGSIDELSKVQNSEQFEVFRELEKLGIVVRESPATDIVKFRLETEAVKQYFVALSRVPLPVKKWAMP